MFQDFMGNPSCAGGLSLNHKLAYIANGTRIADIHVALFRDQLHSALDLFDCQWHFLVRCDSAKVKACCTYFGNHLDRDVAVVGRESQVNQQRRALK